MNKFKKFIKWFHDNETPIIRGVYVIPILFAAFVSINHVIEWYSLTNPHNWAVYLSIGIEIAALSALAGMVRHVNKRVYLPFGIVTLIQIIGNIFYSYQFIDENGHLFKTWLEISGVLFTFETHPIISNKLLIAIISGGLIPIISLSFLHLLVSFNEKEEANKNNNSVIPSGDTSEEITDVVKGEEVIEEIKTDESKPITIPNLFDGLTPEEKEIFIKKWKENELLNRELTVFPDTSIVNESEPIVNPSNSFGIVSEEKIINKWKEAGLLDEVLNEESPTFPNMIKATAKTIRLIKDEQPNENILTDDFHKTEELDDLLDIQENNTSIENTLSEDIKEEVLVVEPIALVDNDVNEETLESESIVEKEVIEEEPIIEDESETIKEEFIENNTNESIVEEETVPTEVIEEVVEVPVVIERESLTLEPPVYRHTSANQKLGQVSIQRISTESDDSPKYQRKRVSPNKNRNL